MKPVPRSIAPLVLIVLLGALVLFLAITSFLAGNLYAACGFILALPVAAALTTFRCSLAPLTVASALSAPLALLTVFFGASLPEVSAALAWSTLLVIVFVVALLAGYFGRYRRSKVHAKHADA